MQVIDKGSNAPAPTQGLDAKKAAVIAKLNATMNSPKDPAPAQAQAETVKDPSKVTLEDLSAIALRAEKTEESGQTATNEPATRAQEVSKAVEEPAKAAEEPLSAQYAQLARKEKAMRLEAQKLKAEREALKAEQEALRKPPAPSIDESKYISRDKFEADPLAALAEMGISYDALTQRALNAPSPEQVELNRTIAELRSEIQSLKGEQDNWKRTTQEQQENGYKQAVAQIRNDVAALVKQGDEYEMVRATQSIGDVVELIERTFKEGLDDDRPAGTLLSIEEAAQMVEEHLLEEALKLAKTKKIQTKLKPAEVTPAVPAKTAESKETKQPQLKTLTNSISTTRQYSAKERALLAAEHGPNWRSKVG